MIVLILNGVYRALHTACVIYRRGAKVFGYSAFYQMVSAPLQKPSHRNVCNGTVLRGSTIVCIRFAGIYEKS